jgi:hypothetical protein
VAVMKRDCKWKFGNRKNKKRRREDSESQKKEKGGKVRKMGL